jgi:transcription elongation factor Elf1
MGTKAIHTRLARVVQAMIKAAAECPVCGGNAGSVLRVTIDDEPMRPVETCTKCGRMPHTAHLVIDFDDGTA